MSWGGSPSVGNPGAAPAVPGRPPVSGAGPPSPDGVAGHRPGEVAGRGGGQKSKTEPVRACRRQRLLALADCLISRPCQVPRTWAVTGR